MPYYTVKYQAATYSGKRRVQADDEDHAIAKVKSEIRREMSIPMYYESYKVVDADHDEEEEE